MSDAFDRVIFRGKLMDKKTKNFLENMEAILGYELTVVQGSYNPGGVAQSGGTHDGGGVVDLAAYDWKNKVKVAADLGAFVWRRPYIQGLWGEHIHLGIRNHGKLSDTAKRQQVDWDSRPPRDGLANHAVMNRDIYYHPMREIGFKYPMKPTPPAPEPNNVTKGRDALVEAIHLLGQSAALFGKADDDRVVVKRLLDEMKVNHRELRGILKDMPKS